MDPINSFFFSFLSFIRQESEEYFILLKQRTQQILNYSSLGFPYWVPHSTSHHRPGPKDDGSVSLRRASSLARSFISSSSPLLFFFSRKKRRFKTMPLEDTAADRSFGVTVVLIAIHLDKIVTRSARTVFTHLGSSQAVDCLRGSRSFLIGRLCGHYSPFLT